MNSYTKRRLITVGGAVCFLLGMGLIIVGQRAVSWGRLGVMLLGLCGILVLLYLYNRSVEKPKPVAKSGKKSPR